MQGGARFIRLFAALLAVAALTPAFGSLDASSPWLSKLDPVLQERVLSNRKGSSPVIIRFADGRSLETAVQVVEESGGEARRRLPIIDGQVAVIPNSTLLGLAAKKAVERISLDRPVLGANELTSATVGATATRQALGYDGAGVGVAIIDSGVSVHDDLADASGAQRVVRFVDFVNGQKKAYDDYGHGTHVAGIIAGNGADSGGARAGIAPGARLIVLKALDGSGRGVASDVIAAMDYAVQHRGELNIGVINLSVASGVYESYETDPLTLAARRAVSAGIVVVSAAGNNGQNGNGATSYGGVTAPGNAPWVVTVGASSHMGTVDRADDRIAAFSGRGPAAVDFSAKPDLVAPGVGTESLASPGSLLYKANGPYLLQGTVQSSYLPYLSLSGTSMAAPVVSGTVALMLQANPALTPNAVKAILQYTAQSSTQLDRLTQGAGFLNAAGAVTLAKYFAQPSSQYPSTTSWSKQLIWGNLSVKGGRLTPDANAWSTGVTWGADTTSTGSSVNWGAICITSGCEYAIGRWSLSWSLSASKAKNVVWGKLCGGQNCSAQWTVSGILAADEGDTVVWGTMEEADTVVWGTVEELDTVVWGTDEGDTVVWGTSCTSPSCVPVIWPRQP
jgi:serine protease AprX